MKEVRDQNNSSQQALNNTTAFTHNKDNSSSDFLRENIQKQLKGNLDFAGKRFSLIQSYSSQKAFLIKTGKTSKKTNIAILP
jgi:hypothetical protein